MDQLLTSASRVMLRSCRSHFQPAFNIQLRYLTQADVPPKSPIPDKHTAGEPGLKRKAVSGAGDQLKEQDAGVKDSRMTSAGILLPKDSAVKIDAKSSLGKRDLRKSRGDGSKVKDDKDRSVGLERMQAWQISRFGDIAGLKLVEDAKVPSLSDPFDMLVEIHAASVNPFDIERTRGFGENLIEKMRNVSNFFPIPNVPNITSMFTRKEEPFPLTLGRDFSGIVVDVGKQVTGIRSGDEVYGVIGPHRQGTFAEYAATSNWCVSKKPKTITHTEAASIPYIACTAWSAMKLVANLPNRNENTRVLVVGGSGGVGSFAIQYLKTLGVHVTTVCGTDGLDLVAKLGADDVIDYKTSNTETELDQRDKFDVIFHVSGGNQDHLKKYLKGNLKSFFVTLTYPLLKNFDDHGSFAGLLKSGANFTSDYFKGLTKGNHTVWGFFTPNGPFLEEVAGLIEKGRIQPVVGKTFPFKDLPAAFHQVDSGDTNGKVIVQIKKD